MGSGSSKGGVAAANQGLATTRASISLQLDEQLLPQHLFPHIYGSSSVIDASTEFDIAKAIALECRDRNTSHWELTLAVPTECCAVYYKFFLAAEVSAESYVAEECAYRIFNPKESSETKSVASFRLGRKLCNAKVTITGDAGQVEVGKEFQNDVLTRTNRRMDDTLSTRCVSIKDLVLVGMETSEPASPQLSPSKVRLPNESSPEHRFEDHQGLFVDRSSGNSPILQPRNTNDISLLGGNARLDDAVEDMPEAAGAVAAAALSERMLLPKERRQIAIVLVGLPARGKTFTAVKLTRYLRWLGHDTKHFNVGKYRRQKHGCTQVADFFRGDNQEGVDARNEIAALAMEDMLSWMKGGGQIGVFDATNSTKERRRMILKMAEGKCKVIFLETICNDQSIIDRNIILKIQQSPDYADQPDSEAALMDFKARLENYEKVYEPVDQGSYIKMIDTVTGEGGQIQVNCISGYLPGRIVFFLVNTHITPRPILLTRHGESMYNLTGQIGGDPGLSEAGEAYALKLAEFIDKKLGSESTASIWTSTLQRTILTACHVARFPKVQWRALDEINAGICDCMTYEEIREKMPDEYAARKLDKLRYRYPRGESYLDVIQRLEPVIIELERQRAPVVVIAHQALLRSLYAYFADKPLKEIPHIEVPLHTVIEIQMGVTGIQEKRHKIMEDN